MIICITQASKGDTVLPARVVVTIRVTPYSREEKAFSDKEYKDDYPIIGGIVKLVDRKVVTEDNTFDGEDVQHIVVSKDIERALYLLRKICPFLSHDEAIDRILTVDESYKMLQGIAEAEAAKAEPPKEDEPAAEATPSAEQEDPKQPKAE